MLEKIYDIILPEVDWISCKLGLHETQLQNHMFCSLKIKKDMESELSGIFGVKLVAKSITELSLQCDVISEETYKCSEWDCYTLVFRLLNSEHS